MTKKYIFANWKMNPTSFEEARHLLSQYENFGRPENLEIVVCPPVIDLVPLQQSSKHAIEWGAQNCSWEKSGAYTGEISPSMLRERGVGFVIVGHSERRQNFGETDESVNRKVRLLLAMGLSPVICVGGGANLKEESKKIETTVAAQVESAFSGVQASTVKSGKVFIAYEPVWAIGTGKAASVQHASDIAEVIRKTLEKKYDTETAQSVALLYGGSVTSENGDKFLKRTILSGFIIGGLSLNPTELGILIKKIEKL